MFYFCGGSLGRAGRGRVFLPEYLESKITRSGCLLRSWVLSTVGWDDGGVILFIRYRESRVVVGSIFWRAPEKITEENLKKNS
jgi:hypothetical protein